MNKTTNYIPQPINTEHITLSPDIRELTERLAENTHDVWAMQRIAEGWTYGPRRNDETKQHPGLVAYASLTEGEKEYDRKTALESLRLIVALGYTIQKR